MNHVQKIRRNHTHFINYNKLQVFQINPELLSDFEVALTYTERDRRRVRENVELQRTTRNANNLFNLLSRFIRSYTFLTFLYVFQLSQSIRDKERLKDMYADNWFNVIWLIKLLVSQHQYQIEITLNRTFTERKSIHQGFRVYLIWISRLNRIH